MAKLDLLPRHFGSRVVFSRWYCTAQHSTQAPAQRRKDLTAHILWVLNRFGKNQKLASVYLDSHQASVNTEVSKAHRFGAQTKGSR